MDAAKAIEAMEKARKLPLGHTDIKKTRAVVDKIYSRCHKLQSYWVKRIGDKHNYRFDLTAAQCLKFCNDLCAQFGAKPIKKIVYHSPEVIQGSGGHYSWYKKEIHFAYTPRLTTVVHELAHHFSNQLRISDAHGKDFCQVMDWIFQEVYKKYSTKKLNPYWLTESQKIINED